MLVMYQTVVDVAVLPLLCTSPPTPLPPFTRLKPTRDGYTSERAVYQCDAGYVTKSRVLETSLLCENGAWVQVGDSVVCGGFVCLFVGWLRNVPATC